MRRRLGVGRVLGKHVVQRATAAGYRGIQLNAVVETNTGAVRVWQTLGFEIPDPSRSGSGSAH